MIEARDDRQLVIFDESGDGMRFTKSPSGKVLVDLIIDGKNSIPVYLDSQDRIELVTFLTSA